MAITLTDLLFTNAVLNPILVIEDEPLIRRAYRRILELNGFSVEEATNAREGELKLESLEYGVSVVLLDLLMPEYDGNWFFTQQNDKLVEKGIPVVVLSGHVDPQDRFPASCKRVLTKPVSTEALVKTLSELQPENAATKK